MKFSDTIWRFRDNTREHDGYLFVDATTGRIFPITYTLMGKRYRHFGYGLWFHEFADYEIVTTHIRSNNTGRWMHEFYRIDGDFMQWSNHYADIHHEKVTQEEVPEGFMIEFRRLLEKSASMTRPDFEPSIQPKA